MVEVAAQQASEEWRRGGHQGCLQSVRLFVPERRTTFSTHRLLAWLVDGCCGVWLYHDIRHSFAVGDRGEGQGRHGGLAGTRNTAAGLILADRESLRPS